MKGPGAKGRNEEFTHAGLTIEYRPLSSLVPRPNNPRTHSEKQILELASSIESFGFTNPVLIDGSGKVVAGHGRVRAAQRLGLETVPTVRLEHLSADQARAYVIADFAPRPHRVSERKDSMAERVGFEPTVGCPTHAFQACAFDRSAISPGTRGRRGLDPASGAEASTGGPNGPRPPESAG